MPALQYWVIKIWLFDSDFSAQNSHIFILKLSNMKYLWFMVLYGKGKFETIISIDIGHMYDIIYDVMI